MRYKAILFDLDGTLLDTLEDLATAANRALGTLGLPAHPTDAYRVFVGDGLRTLAERILPGEQRSAAQVDALVAAFEREYSRTWNERTAPYAGVPEVLYLGDTATDMHSARAAGMAAVGVLWGFRSADELRAAGARHLITHPGELPPLLHPSSAPRS